MKIYIGERQTGFYKPEPYEAMMEQFKKDLAKFPYLTQVEYEAPLQNEDLKKLEQLEPGVLILTSDIACFNETMLLPILKERKVLLIKCGQAQHPRSSLSINKKECLQHLVMLEYKESIMEVRSHIYSYFAMQHCYLQTKKPI